MAHRARRTGTADHGRSRPRAARREPRAGRSLENAGVDSAANRPDLSHPGRIGGGGFHCLGSADVIVPLLRSIEFSGNSGAESPPMLSLSTCWNSHRHEEGEHIAHEARRLGFAYIELSHGLKVSH